MNNFSSSSVSPSPSTTTNELSESATKIINQLISMNAFSRRNEYYILSALSCVGLISSIYYLRLRKNPNSMYVIRPRNAPSHGNKIQNDDDEENLRDGESGKNNSPTGAIETKEEVENGNIGFGTDPSWFHYQNNSKKTDLLHTGSRGGKLIIAMVGLPGSGKTYMARKISRFLRWISYRTRVYSLAKYRLEKYGTKNADFFDPENEACAQTRVELLLSALEDSLIYLRRDGEIAIIDGANTTMNRRDIIRNRVLQEDGYDILWIENVIDPELIISRNSASIHASPDFNNDEDFIKRMEHYRKSYETLQESEGSYIKRYDSGDRIHLYGIHGFVRTKISSFVMNIHTAPRTIYLVRTAETEYIKRGMIGGDSPITPEGLEFSIALGHFFETDDTDFVVSSNELVVWSSTQQSSLTAKKIKCSRYVEWRALRNIESGVCDGLTYEQIKAKYPREFKARQADKLRYRYPQGESYVDLITRLEPVIFEAERETHPLIIVAPLAVLRCLYAYFLDLPMEDLPHISIKLHTVIRLDPKAYGCKEKRVKIIRSDQNDSDDENDIAEQKLS